MQDLESSEAALRQLRGLCKGETTVVAFDSTQSQTSAKSNETIMTDETALKPDAGKEADLKVEDNPFAFTPGQLGQMFNPKDLSAFYQLGGLHGLEKGLRADRKPILNLDDTGLEEQVTFRDVRDAVRNDKMRDDCTEPLEVPHSFIKPAVSASTKFWIKDSSWVLGRSWVTRYSEKEGWKLFVCHYRKLSSERRMSYRAPLTWLHRHAEGARRLLLRVIGKISRGPFDKANACEQQVGQQSHPEGPRQAKERDVLEGRSKGW